ncbi:MAG: formyltransferase family protein [Microcoleaceae cyanobacterium]
MTGELRAKTFNCFIIGQGTLPIQCAEIILASGHQIAGVVSSDSSIVAWAKEQKIPHLKPERPSIEIPKFLSKQPFDYLFSIVNFYILKKKVLELPRFGAINYHDSLLPKYAGVHATSWALMQGEKTHGITWHLMTDRVDAGDILKQVEFDIAPRETALSLNGKCYERTIDTFRQLIEELSRGGVSPRKQKLDEGSYFGRDRRPEAGCVISWNRRAEEIDAFIRSISFGAYPNPLGMPKLAIGKQFLIVPEIQVLNSLSSTPPGTITRITPTLQISTASYEVALPKLLSIDGQNLAISEVVAKFGLYEGYRVADLWPEVAAHLSQCDREICQHEAFWLKRLAKLETVSLPYATVGKVSGQPRCYESLKMSLPEEVLAFLERGQKTWSVVDFLLAAFVAYLSRIGATERFDIGYRDVREREWVSLEGFFASSIPLRIDIDPKQSFEAVLNTVLKELDTIRQHKTYGRDIVTRYPELEKIHPFSVVVERVGKLGDGEILSFESESSLTIRVVGRGNRMPLVIRF